VIIANNLPENRLPLQKEVFIAEALAEQKGMTVLLRGSNTPNGDATIRLADGTRLRAEFKTLEKPGVPIEQLPDNRIKRIFERNIREGSAQINGFPSAVVIDTRALPLSAGDVSEHIGRSLPNIVPNRPNLQHIFAVTPEGVIQIPVKRRP
jgi:filamentous hemagglutinin